MMSPYDMLALALIAPLPACSGTVVAVGDSGPLPILPADVAPTPPGCSEPRLVPAGAAWLTPGVGMDSDGSLLIDECPGEVNLETGAPVQRFTVPAVFLDTTEVTNTCYAACVDEGACGEPSPLPSSWDDAAQADYAVSIVPETAEAFCAWRGGRLPTVLELARASHGDLLHVGNPTLFEKLRNCHIDAFTHGAAGADCDDLLNRHMHGGLPAGSVATDVGPFGHHDLFGGFADVTATVLDADRVCAHPPGAADPGSFGDDWLNRGYFRVRMDDPSHDPPAYTGNAGIGYSDGSPFYEAGVRCAYDPVYVDPEIGSEDAQP